MYVRIGLYYTYTNSVHVNDCTISSVDIYICTCMCTKGCSKIPALRLIYVALFPLTAAVSPIPLSSITQPSQTETSTVCPYGAAQGRFF